MSKHVWEKWGKRADGESDGQRDGRRIGRTDGDPDGRTSPYNNTSRLKTGVLKDIASSNMCNIKEHVFRLNCMCVQTYYVYKIHTQICILGTASWDGMEDIIWATELLVLLGHQIFLFCISEKKMHFWRHLIHPCHLITYKAIPMYQTHKQFYDTISSHQNNKMVQKYAILLRTLHDSQTFRNSVNTCINYAHSHSHYDMMQLTW